eukprot:m.640450 g.640450  ORF g.640450 m.640450 type:complete len:124 (-) comp22621_c0_seq6:347-718(-)
MNRRANGIRICLYLELTPARAFLAEARETTRAHACPCVCACVREREKERKKTRKIRCQSVCAREPTCSHASYVATVVAHPETIAPFPTTQIFSIWVSATGVQEAWGRHVGSNHVRSWTAMAFP